MTLKHHPKESFLNTINQVQLAIKSSGVYPEDHPITIGIINNSYEALTEHLASKKVLTCRAMGSKLWVDDVPLESSHTLSVSFALELEQRAIESLSFHRGLSPTDYQVFIKAMTQKLPSQGKGGDVATVLKKNGVSTIRLNDVRYEKVTGAPKEEGYGPAIHHLDLDGAPLGKEKKVHALPRKEPHADEARKTAECVRELLAGKKSQEIEFLSDDATPKSDEIRKNIAERLQDVTSDNDEFETIKNNFQKISDTLIDWLKRENHVDTYLSVNKSLHNICVSLNKLECYLTNETVGGRLFEGSKLSKTELQEALKARKKNGNSLQYNLGALHLVDEGVLTQFLAQQYKNCPIVHLASIKHIKDSTLKMIPEKYVRRYQILPFMAESGNLYTATMNPDDWQVFKDIRFVSGFLVVPHLAAEYYLLNSIEKFYNIKSGKSLTPQAAGKMQQEDWNSDLELVEEKRESVESSEELKDSDAPIIKLANVILDEAIKQKVSDIHIEPYEHELRIRLRMDGTLITVLNPSKSYASGLSSRIKIMSGLDISERRLPQDGRFKVRKNGKVVDFRVSVFPGIFGEKIVLRLLDDANLILDTNRLGFNEDDLAHLLSAMYKSKGMMLFTGPTGSGKTTSIYSILHTLNDGTLNISTAEDPIEYNLKGINQFQMNGRIGLNFARALRTFLRQDPDVIMVGEIRDFETAEIAFKAALTGHLVLSTLHTNSAPETIARLLNIGVEPYMIASSVNLIVAQRLARKNCDHCKVEATPTDLQLNLLRNYGFSVNGHRFAMGEGCEKCGNTGYKGRVAIYEVMPLWKELQEMIITSKSAFEVRAKAEELGFVSLQAQGFSKVVQGVVSLNEWMRVLA